VTRAPAPDVHTTAESRLRTVGQRYTEQRRAIVRALEAAGRPRSMPELLADSGLPQSSVYRNLTVLEHAGVARRVVTEEDFARYELTEDLTEHHHHLICSTCGRVEDVTIPTALERDVDRALDRLAKQTGFAKVAHRLDLIGTCRDCAGASG
jgi:Fur family transcriptional regulator, ferric uptake regulator